MSNVTQQSIATGNKIATTMKMDYISEGSVSHINGVWPISKQLQLVGRVTLYNAHWKQAAHVRKNAINTQPRGHTSTFFQAYVCWLFLIFTMPISTVSDAVPIYC